MRKWWNSTSRTAPAVPGRIVQIDGDRAIIQVFEGTRGISLENTTHHALLAHPMEMALSKEMLGRVFDGAGRPIDGLGEIYPEEKRRTSTAQPINPVSRTYPRNYINTGISAIDCTDDPDPRSEAAHLLRLRYAAQQAGRPDRTAGQHRWLKSGQEFGIVFAAMGVNNDVADYFRRSFEETGVMDRVVMFLNLSNDPIIERILTPRCALTAAEYLAFEQDMHILVIMTDMTSYCEALREFSSSKGEIPGRKGYPGYLYSDLASLYERAGIIERRQGLGYPDPDPDHAQRRHHPPGSRPDRLYHRGSDRSGPLRWIRTASIRPSRVLPSLSRLMKDGIGEGYTRADHSARIQPALCRLCQGTGCQGSGFGYR